MATSVPQPQPARKARLNIGPEELETFLAIAELGSFSKAAERLSLSQPSISNRMQRLERAVRARLFERTTRAVVLTPAGERLRARVEPILNELHAVLDEFQEDAEARGQHVALATTPMLAAIFMPPVIQRFTRRNPMIKIELHDEVTIKLIPDLRARRVDFAVLAEEVAGNFPGIAYEKLATDYFMLVGPRGHAALADGIASSEVLTRHPFLLLSNYQAKITELAAGLAARDLILSPVNTVTNVSTLLGFVSTGLGLTLLPSIILRAGGIIDDTRFSVAALSDISLVREFGIVSLPGHTLSPSARAFCTALRAEMAGLNQDVDSKAS